MSKRLNLDSDERNLKRQNIRSKSQSIEEISKNFLLLRLPEEVLENIYGYLNFKSLVSVRSLNFEKINNVMMRLESFDVSKSNDISPLEVSSFFTSNSMQNIRKLSFNFLFLVDPAILTKIIVSCKQLTSLSVIECGMTFLNINEILDCCDDLTELFCNVETKFLNEEECQKKTHLKMKYLYLCINSWEINFEGAVAIYKRCKSVSEVVMNFSSSLIPFRYFNSILTFKFQHGRNSSLYFIYDSLSESECKIKYEHLLSKLFNCKLKTWSFFSRGNLQLDTSSKGFFLLPEIVDKDVHRLTLYCTNQVFLMKHMGDVNKVAGKKLSHLEVKQNKYGIPLELQIENIAINYMNEIIEELTRSCCNIRHLILSDVHFCNDGFDFKAIYHIKGLRTLILPVCAFPCHSCNTELNKDFAKLIKECEFVEHFALCECNHCENFRSYCVCGPSEMDMEVISGWSKLKSLCLADIKTLRTFSFLKSIAHGCPELRSLDILRYGKFYLCHHLQSLIYLLNKSNNLVFLSTSLDANHVNDENFWSSLESVKCLQGICLRIVPSCKVEEKLLIATLEKLQFLHLFHMTSTFSYPSLSNNIKEIMTKHGIMNPKIGVFHNTNNSPCKMAHIDFP